ncbi:MAG: hypothetical protein WAQ53_09935 [Thiofilum sp.]|uniref:hypothetical protein n=1 Tax=Thiofilum sp. TaxID=2212733 RepID=UPI0025DBD037|nr:hypothetical protein [Thiofilum sp.]MBK8453180.1 hypothetical protein [Thiofilum sp.]
MPNDNIFAAPQAEVQDLAGGQGLYSDTVVLALRRTRPWVMVMGALGLISAVFMLLAVVGMIATGMGDVAFGAGMAWPMAAIYLILTVITFIASIQLFRFAAAIKRALSTMQPVDLDDVLLTQANFWRLVGILSLVMLILSFAMVGMMAFMLVQSGI